MLYDCHQSPSLIGWNCLQQLCTKAHALSCLLNLAFWYIYIYIHVKNLMSGMPKLFLAVRQPWKKSCLPVHSWPASEMPLMVFSWGADDDPTLNAGLVALLFFKGSRPVLLENTMFLWFFRGGPEPCPPPPLLDPRMKYTRTKCFKNVLRLQLVCLVRLTTSELLTSRACPSTGGTGCLDPPGNHKNIGTGLDPLKITSKLPRQYSMLGNNQHARETPF